MKRNNKQDKGFWGFVRQCPLVVLVILSVIGFTIYTLFGAMDGEYNIHISMDHTIFMSAMIKEDPFLSEHTKDETAEAVDTTETTEEPEPATSTDVMVQTATQTDQPATDMSEPIPTTYETVAMRPARSPYYNDNDKVACTTGYDYIEVGPEYFNDAAFIGDSRIEGLHDYGTFREKTTADFYFKDGVSIWDLMDVAMSDGATIPASLSAKQYKKIFIMCGVNELGNGFANDYQEQYKEVLDELQSLQPDAVIFVIGIMHVTQNYSDNSDVFNNDNIDCRNALVAQYADGQKIFYLDMNSAVCDMDGNVPGGVKSDYSNDGIHLQAQYYTLWENYMMQHGIREE